MLVSKQHQLVGINRFCTQSQTIFKQRDHLSDIGGSKRGRDPQVSQVRIVQHDLSVVVAIDIRNHFTQRRTIIGQASIAPIGAVSSGCTLS